MSMNSSIVYGYGFEIDDVTVKQICEFIQNHRAAFCKSIEEKVIYADMIVIVKRMDPNAEEDDWNKIADLFEDYENDVNGNVGMEAAISNIIARETGIDVQYEPGCDACESKPAILLAEAMPWHYSHKEKQLESEDELKSILTDYMTQLGITGEPDMMNVEYFG